MSQIISVSGLLVMASLVAAGQTVQPAFDVVSIKPMGLERQSANIRLTCAGDRFIGSGYTTQTIFRYAFDIQVFQLGGAAPNWFTDRGDTYRVEARAGQRVDESACKAMLRQVFIDRFNVKIHHLAKEFPAYALVVGKSPPKFRPAPATRPPAACKLTVCLCVMLILTNRWPPGA